tara:strand:+ start:2782 stop:2979 length:198 start_codon:yes stop_codon:yes gene_type:complete
MRVEELKKGMRVELHPATDTWMRGDRYGEVVSVPTRGRPDGRVMIHLDKSGKKLYFRPEDIMSEV